MPACVVPGCTSGYKSNKENSHFFNVPKNPEALELWRKAIGPTNKSIKSGQSVCNKHFRDKEILWKRELLGPDGAVIGVSPYKIPRLKKGSTPSIFGRMECATKPRSSVVRENMLHPEKDSAEAMDCSNIQLFDAVPAISECEEERIPMVPLTIEELIELNQLPVYGWAKQNIRHDNVTSVVFSKAEFRRDCDALKTFPLKEVIITSDLSVNVNILNNPWNITDLQIELDPALTLEQLQNLLLKLDELKVCAGSKLQTELDAIDCRIADKDIGGTWRHVQCSLLLKDKTVCTFCQRIQKTVARKIQRTERHGEPMRIHLRLPPEKNKILSRLQEKVKTAQKATRRAKKALSALKSELDACKEKLKSYSEQSLHYEKMKSILIENDLI